MIRETTGAESAAFVGLSTAWVGRSLVAVDEPVPGWPVASHLGASFVALDPLEWLAHITDHIPDPGRNRTLFYAHYADRAWGARAKKKLLEAPAAEVPEKRRGSPTWARLSSKVYHADPLTCRRCGGPPQIAAYIHDQHNPRAPRSQPS
jgi:hypothetical protein